MQTSPKHLSDHDCNANTVSPVALARPWGRLGSVTCGRRYQQYQQLAGSRTAGRTDRGLTYAVRGTRAHMSPVSTAALIAGRYRLDYQLASDQVAEVWRATDLELARPIAVKLLYAGTRDADAVGQFRAAACRAASLVRENLVRASTTANRSRQIPRSARSWSWNT